MALLRLATKVAALPGESEGEMAGVTAQIVGAGDAFGSGGRLSRSAHATPAAALPGGPHRCEACEDGRAPGVQNRSVLYARSGLATFCTATPVAAQAGRASPC